MSYAVEYASPRIVELFLDRGGDVRKGELLHHALDRRDHVKEVLTMLLDRGAPLNSKMYENHWFSRGMYQFMGLGTPLHKAAELGNQDIVRFLLSRGAETEIKDQKGRTAMDCAEKYGYPEVSEILKYAVRVKLETIRSSL